MMNLNTTLPYYSDNDLFGFLLECMRQGRADIIQNYCSNEEKRVVCDQMFRQDRAYTLRVCMILWVDAVRIAGKAGIPNSVIDKTFEKCINKSKNAKTPWMLLRISEDYLIEFAQIINDSTCEFGFSPVYLRFRKYIRDHIYESFRIEDIASALNISKSHLSHTIKDVTGESVHNWVLKEKVNAAKLMMSKKTYSMNEIWHSLGFCSQSHFAKCFRQVTGMTPSQFKAEINGMQPGL